MARAEYLNLLTTTYRSWPEPGHGPWQVHMYWVDVDGRPECVGVAVFGGSLLVSDGRVMSNPQQGGVRPVTSEAWRIPFGQLIAESRATLAAEMVQTLDLGRLEAALGRPPGKRAREEHARWEAWRDSDTDQFDVRGWPPGHLRTVASVYLDARVGTSAPTKAVAEHFQTSKTAAAKWVARCRELGLLPPTTQGRAAGAPRPVKPAPGRKAR